ncbi:MAG: T9SS type A sorting domain-containing protein [Bacteroidota bacterium]
MEARPGLEISPNPAQNDLYLHLENSHTPIESIEILDAAGRNCSQFMDWKTTDYGTGQLYIQRLPAGWYCVRVRCSDRVLVGRFVKE